MMTSHRRMFPGSVINPVVSRAFAVRPDAEQRAERVERIEPTVKAERELVQIGLQVLGADAAMMRALQPSLQIRENKVDDGEIFFGHRGVAALDNGKVLVAEISERVVAAPGVRNDHRAWLYRLLYKGRQRLSAARWHDFQTQAPGIPATAPHGLVALLSGPGADLDSSHDQRFVLSMNALALAARFPADVGFVNLDMIATGQIAADAVAVLPHHSRAELVEDLESRLAGQAELALELNRRNAGRHGRNQIGTPKPRRQRRVRSRHDGPDRQRRLLAAFAASQDGLPRCHAKWLALFVAVRANEALGPLGPFEPSGAGVIVREKPLEVPERLGERQVFPLENVGKGRHGSGHLRNRCRHFPLGPFFKLPQKTFVGRADNRLSVRTDYPVGEFVALNAQDLPLMKQRSRRIGGANYEVYGPSRARFRLFARCTARLPCGEAFRAISALRIIPKVGIAVVAKHLRAATAAEFIPWLVHLSLHHRAACPMTKH